MMKVNVCWWTRRDTAQVLEIERLSAKAQGREPDDEKYFLSLLDEDPIVGCVAHKGGDVLAFVIYELFPHRIDIVHFEVHPEWHGMGIESQVVENLIVKCQNKGRNTISWTVREKNVGLQLVLRGLGGKCVGIKRDFYPNTRESGYYFEFSVAKPVNHELPIQL